MEEKEPLLVVGWALKTAAQQLPTESGFFSERGMRDEATDDESLRLTTVPIFQLGAITKSRGR